VAGEAGSGVSSREPFGATVAVLSRGSQSISVVRARWGLDRSRERWLR